MSDYTITGYTLRVAVIYKDCDTYLPSKNTWREWEHVVGPEYGECVPEQDVIANAKAPKTDKTYALFRAINCYAPAGYNSCGGQDVAPAVRKAWFRQLKSGFADTQWGKSLQYYW